LIGVGLGKLVCRGRVVGALAVKEQHEQLIVGPSGGFEQRRPHAPAAGIVAPVVGCSLSPPLSGAPTCDALAVNESNPFRVTRRVVAVGATAASLPD
jgi:hypothetical protein